MTTKSIQTKFHHLAFTLSEEQRDLPESKLFTVTVVDFHEETPSEPDDATASEEEKIQALDRAWKLHWEDQRVFDREFQSILAGIRGAGDRACEVILKDAAHRCELLLRDSPVSVPCVRFSLTNPDDEANPGREIEDGLWDAIWPLMMLLFSAYRGDGRGYYLRSSDERSAYWLDDVYLATTGNFGRSLEDYNDCSSAGRRQAPRWHHADDDVPRRVAEWRDNPEYLAQYLALERRAA